MRGRLVVLAAVASAAAWAGAAPRARATAAQTSVQTGGERAAAAAVSSYDDVVRTLHEAAAAAPDLVHVGDAGTTAERRAIPLAVLGAGLADAGPDAFRAARRLRVWVRAGVHGDDAAGVEAATGLVRDIAAGRHREWFTAIALVVTPVVNPDGYARVSPEHLGRRNGPAGGVGQRPNAGNVNIDHDYVRLDSPEARAMVAVLTDFDPQVAIDLRTDEAACAAAAIAYAAPLNPDVHDQIASLVRLDWAPFVARSLQSKYKLVAAPAGRVDGATETCGLPATAAAAPAAAAPRRGSASGRSSAPGRAASASVPARGARTGGRGGDGGSAAPSVTDAPRAVWTSAPDAPRTFASYAGLRNRMTLTGASDGFAPFAARVQASTRFLEEAVAFTYAAAGRIEKAVQAAGADMLVNASLATSWQPMVGGRTDVVTGTVTPAAEAGRYARAPQTTPLAVTDRTAFQADESENVAAEYYVPESLTAVLDRLRAHGIQLRQLTRATRAVEQFVITGKRDMGLVDGHVMAALAGAWQPAPDVVVPAGTWVVRMNQRAARLAFVLLEPASNDGLAAWDVVDAGDATTYPILRKR